MNAGLNVVVLEIPGQPVPVFRADDEQMVGVADMWSHDGQSNVRDSSQPVQVVPRSSIALVDPRIEVFEFYIQNGGL